MSKKIITQYFHSDKGDMWQTARDLNMSEEACKVFQYALYEVAIEIEIDIDTGEYKILSVKE